MPTIEKRPKIRVALESLLPKTAERLEHELGVFENKVALRKNATLQFKNKDAEVQYEVVVWANVLHEIKSFRGNDLRKCLEEARKTSSRPLYAYANIGEISISLRPEDPILNEFVGVTFFKEETNDGVNARVVWTTVDRGLSYLTPARWGKAIDI